MDQLKLSVTPDGDGVWQVHAHLQTNTFCGLGWAWGAADDLVDFANLLAAYPIPADAPAVLRLSYGEGVRVEVRPVGHLGTLEARVEIADPDDPTCRLKAKLMTSYASVARLVPELRALAAGQREVATLVGG